MDIRQRLDEDLKTAMRARDSVRLETVRNVRGAMRAREIDSGKELDEQEITKLIRGLVKQREDSIVQYREGGRADLVERESAEKALLEAYLPPAASSADVERVVGEVVAELGATTIKDMGRVMKAALERLGPTADGKLVSAAVKSKLG
ncbi:MAG TPA: GatB/YqeY domain-containing protein [Polyangiales bacterium]|nr:GatB/YqeY domain-containing protein [Polyangiales bacterium]